MTKKKTNYALWTVICLVSILAVGTIAVVAFSGTATTVIENAGGVTINNPVQPTEEQPLGAVVSADSLPAMVCTNDDCTYTASGDLMHASTTLISFVDPFLKATSSAADVVVQYDIANAWGWTGATSTVDNIRIEITTAATSTFNLTCGANDVNFGDPNVDLLTITGGISTSSVGIVENNLTAALGGIVDAGTVEKITLNPTYPYFTCLATIPTAYDGALTTAATEALAGRWSATVHKTR